MNGDQGSSAYMRSVMPSQVVQTIDELFPHVARGQGGDGWIQAQHSSKLIGIISLAKAIPHELFAVSASDYASFVLAVSTIEFHVAVWTARGPVGSMDLVGGTDVVTVLRRVLIKCLDEYPPPSTTELLFIAQTTNCATAFAAIWVRRTGLSKILNGKPPLFSQARP
jgi:hypothetical protein